MKQKLQQTVASARYDGDKIIWLSCTTDWLIRKQKRRNGRLKNLIKVRCKTTYLLPVIIKGFSTFFFTLKIFIHCFHSLWLALFCNEEKSHKITRKLCAECVPRVHRAYCLAWKCFLLYIKSFQKEQKKISPPLFGSHILFSRATKCWDFNVTNSNLRFMWRIYNYLTFKFRAGYDMFWVREKD